MKAALLLAVLVVVALGIAVPIRLLARRRAPVRPVDDTGDELVRSLTEEVRKWQAEAAYWRSTAERLQRELDGRGGD